MSKLKTDYKEGEEFIPSAEQLNLIGTELNGMQNISFPDPFWKVTKATNAEGQEVITPVPNMEYLTKVITDLIAKAIPTQTTGTIKLGK